MSRSSTDTLFGSLVRAKILRFFAVQPEGRWANREELSKRLRFSRALIQRELSQLLDMGILERRRVGIADSHRGRRRRAKHKKTVEVFFISETLPFRSELRTVVLRVLPPLSVQGLRAIRSAGKIQLLIFTGNLIGAPSLPTDILIVGDNLRRQKILRVLKNFEQETGLDLRYTTLTTDEFLDRRSLHDRFLRDILEVPHHRLIDTLLLKKEDKSQEQKTKNATLPLGA